MPGGGRSLVGQSLDIKTATTAGVSPFVSNTNNNGNGPTPAHLVTDIGPSTLSTTNNGKGTGANKLRKSQIVN